MASTIHRQHRASRARPPADAPEGTRGISLFLVPKFLVNEDGTPGRRNDVFCGGLSTSSGIHGSPTCTMIYGDALSEGMEPGAIGWLVGEENRGLACMFHDDEQCPPRGRPAGRGRRRSRLPAGARLCELERKQGKAASQDGAGMAPIIHHPDVQRTLLTMQALTQAARAIGLSCATRPTWRAPSPPAPRLLARARQSPHPAWQSPSRRCRAWRSPRWAFRCMAAAGSSRRRARPCSTATRASRRSTRARMASRPSTSSCASCAVGAVIACAPTSLNCAPTSTRCAAPTSPNSAHRPKPSRPPRRSGGRDDLPRGGGRQRADGERRWLARRPTQALRAGGRRRLPRARRAGLGRWRAHSLSTFFAENLVGENSALKARVTGGARSLSAAAKHLLSA